MPTKTQDKKLRAAIYLRISLDPTGEGLAVERQREDCESIVARRGWHLVGEYKDESISASNSKAKRPGYDALIAAYNSGQFDALVCYDLDRLTRQPRQLEDWIDAAEGRGLALVTANGEADLTTDTGRAFARVKLAFARSEVERKSARQKRAALQRSQLGRPPLGVRLTGYTAKGDTIADEAMLVKRIFAMFRAGESLRSIARILTDEGVTTRKGAAWNPSSISGILKNPRYAGRAIYQGEPTGDKGNWKAIVTDELFDVVQARLNDPRRITNRQGTDRKHLGSGLFLCAACGDPVSSFSGGRYRCKAAHVNRAQKPIDDYVLVVIAKRLKFPDFTNLLAKPATDLAPLLGEQQRLRDRLVVAESDYDAELIDGRRYASAVARIRAEMLTVESQLARADNSAVASLLAARDPSAAFLSAGLMSQRAIISALCEVRLEKGIKYVRAFEPETVEIGWNK